MKVIYHRKKHTDELYDISLRCSPIEALTIMQGLRLVVESEDTHERDRPIAERMLKEMRKEKDEDNTGLDK